MKEYLKKLEWYKWLIIALMTILNIIIFISSCLPAKESTGESNLIVNILVNIINAFKANAINDSNLSIFSGFIRKLIGHFLLFLLSGIFTTLSIKYLYYDVKKEFTNFALFSIGFGFLLAVLTEGIQKLVPGRSGEFRDIMIDFSGYLLSSLILIIIFSLKKTPTMEKEE